MNTTNQGATKGRLTTTGRLFATLLCGALLIFWGTIAKAATADNPTVWNLTAGQYNDVGSVSVWNDSTNLYVTYTLDAPGYTFGQLHLWVGTDLTLVPATKNGTPIPGQFCQQTTGGYCYDATGLVTYTFVVPLTDLNVVNVSQLCNTNIYVVPHAEVYGPGSKETAFGGNTGVNVGSAGRWYYYGTYTITCGGGDNPPPPAACGTSFGKGGWVFTTDAKSNPEGLPSLNLTKNRWGWAYNLKEVGSYTSTLWTGAGLNNTGNGTAVGTVTINWTGTEASVTYDVSNAAYALRDVHLYAGDNKPTTIAPGRYGNLDSFDPLITSYTFNVSLSDSNGDGVWLIAHAVTCK